MTRPSRTLCRRSCRTSPTCPRPQTTHGGKASDIYGEDTQIFEGNIEPSDIKQGALGDCYFLSALSALAEQPDNIKRLFETKTYDKKRGLFDVWLCIDGEFIHIVLDDYFPVIHKQPAFSKGQGKELWVLILEKAYAKAYAKAYGNYHKIESGITGQALRDLTGAPYDSLKTDVGQDEVWKKISDAFAKKFIVTAGSQQSVSKEVEKDLGQGIVSSHAYAVLDCKVVQSNGSERILKLRNPWGQGEWKGDWSDDSNKWTPQLKQQLGWSSANDGIFWIRVDDFCKQFSQICITKLNSGYRYASQPIKLGNNK